MTIAFRYGNPAVDCDGAELRAQCRHLAMVVTISGVIDDDNFDRLTQKVRRLVLAEKPFALDLSGVTFLSARGVSLLYALDDECDLAGVEWAVVSSPAVSNVLRLLDDAFPITSSIPEALHHFAEGTLARRRLLPLLHKTA
ncbi:STAS domain-containing protein [Mycolicibacterium diernhoferi]|uniref:Anti-anti-sigma factor n=1 Tax=Mycolicibacterium diernhoferi TaxID=1801 RepID=A0A1Q4HHS7_9MYCO|nr:STAS domain-containing protein [Mycolicibacterium diernhoferi]OJZ67096.1 anti-anti-sigma factor [Mycolicibacterium diernhoferi]OPE56295.1 anti-anti-sigma factor [Mycolicibacterium diernhoferi]PEG53682.1 anti-sigma factor antagonist [Mycolicibacterium diernhoferi]QYL23293.1 STAS domain-containing protein [Mycolicibacterium diernhoferi]